MRSPLAVLLPHALVLLACTGEDLPPVREKSEWLILRAPEDLEVCAGTFDRMEAEVLQLRSMFDAGNVPIEYSWMPESHYGKDDFPCSHPGSWACTLLSSKKAKDPEVYSRTLAETHELVHASRDRQLPSVLEEGLATVFEAPLPADDDTIVSRDELLEALEAGTWQNASDGYGLYQRAAHFISFLLAEYGQDRFIEFERHVAPRTPSDEAYFRPLADWKAGFQTSYGQSFDEVWVAYEDYPDCESEQFKLPLSACAMLDAAPVATLTPSSPTFMSQFQCGDEDVFGPYIFLDRAETRAIIHTIEIENPFPVLVGVELIGEIADGTRALLTNCGNCREGTGALLTRAEPEDALDLPETGVYVLILYQDIDAPGPVGISLFYI